MAAAATGAPTAGAPTAVVGARAQFRTASAALQRAQEQGPRRDNHVEAQALTACPASKVPAMKAAEPVPRTAVLEPAAAAAGWRYGRAQRRSIRQDGDGASAAACPRLSARNGQKPCAGEIAQGHPGGQHEADHQYEAESLYEVAEAPGEGRREQADGRAKALSTSPSCAAGTPRALTKAGRKGDATPKAAAAA